MKRESVVGKNKKKELGEDEKSACASVKNIECTVLC